MKFYQNFSLVDFTSLRWIIEMVVYQTGDEIDEDERDEQENAIREQHFHTKDYG